MFNWSELKASPLVINPLKMLPCCLDQIYVRVEKRKLLSGNRITFVQSTRVRYLDYFSVGKAFEACRNAAERVNQRPNVKRTAKDSSRGLPRLPIVHQRYFSRFSAIVLFVSTFGARRRDARAQKYINKILVSRRSTEFFSSEKIFRFTRDFYWCLGRRAGKDSLPIDGFSTPPAWKRPLEGQYLSRPGSIGRCRAGLITRRGDEVPRRS